MWCGGDIEKRDDPMIPKDKNPFLYYSNTGCWKWRSEVHFTDDDDGVKAQLDVTATWEVSNPILFPAPFGGNALTGTAYRISEGELNWSISGTNSQGCTFSGSRNNVSLVEVTSSDPENPIPGSNVYHNYSHIIAGKGYRSFTLAGFLLNFQPIFVTVTEICPDDPPDVKQEAIWPVLAFTPGDSMVDSSGTMIGGNGNDALGGNGTVTGTWDFIAERQP